MGDLHSIYKNRCSSIFDGMLARLRERRSSTGVLLQAGRPLPFSRAQFRMWVLGQFGGNVARRIQCAYCSSTLTVADFVVDHRMPLARRGSVGLNNLCLSCASCNRRKGKLSEAGFRALVAWGVTELDRRDFADILGRLARGGVVVRSKGVQAA